MKPTPLLFLILLTLQSKSQNPITIEQSHLLLNGTWNWYRTVHDYRGDAQNNNETPEFCSCTKKIVFRDHSILEYYSNDTLISSENYTVENSRSEPSDVLILRSTEFNGFLKFPIGAGSIGATDSLGIGWFGSCATLRYFVREIAGGN